MKEYIRKLKTKDESLRKQIVILSVVVCMVFVVSIWIFSLGGRLNDKKLATDKSDNSIGFFSSLKESLGDTYKSITASVGNVSLPKKDEVVNEERQIDLIPVEPSN